MWGISHHFLNLLKYRSGNVFSETEKSTPAVDFSSSSALGRTKPNSPADVPQKHIPSRIMLRKGCENDTEMPRLAYKLSYKI